MTDASSSFVCVISRHTPGNWPLCKESGTYGLSGHRTPPNVRKGDSLFVWIGGRGYVAELKVTADRRPPKNRAEAPWAGGFYQYGFVIPFELVLEVKSAVNFRFEGQRQEKTGVSKSGLQRSIAPLTPDAADAIRAALRESAASDGAA